MRRETTREMAGHLCTCYSHGWVLNSNTLVSFMHAFWCVSSEIDADLSLCSINMSLWHTLVSKTK